MPESVRDSLDVLTIFVIAVVTAIAVMSVTGCAAVPRHLGASPPEDLVVELSVVRGPAAPPVTGLADRDGRWVLFPDGSLHYGARPAAEGHDWLPGRTRTLSRPQMAGLWERMADLGFTDRAAASPPVNLDLVELPRDGVLYAIVVRADGERWAYVDAYAPDDIPASQAELARTLGALVWIPDAPPIKARVLPKRYDFGPDPYARYRAAAPEGG